MNDGEVAANTNGAKNIFSANVCKIFLHLFCTPNLCFTGLLQRLFFMLSLHQLTPRFSQRTETLETHLRGIIAGSHR
jgi:hypothetical protein